MSWIVIEGARPYDGRYEFDFVTEFNVHEWGWIKRLSGYLPLTVDEGLAGGDPELITVFAVIALHRAGKIRAREVPDVFGRIADAPFGTTVQLEIADVEEDDAGPPAPSSTESESTSGAGSMTSSETSDSAQNGSGIHDSDTSAWAPQTSES